MIRTLRWVRAAIVGLLLLASACRTYDPQVFDERLRAATFDIYWEELDRNYPYFERKGIDWSAVRNRYRDDALAAGTRNDFFKVLVRMLNELDDPHVSLEWSVRSARASLSEISTVPCALAVVDRRLRVEWLPGIVGVDSTRVDDHVPTEYPVLLAVDGCPVRQPGTASLLLWGKAGTTSRLTLAWRSKPEEEVVLTRPKKMTWSFPVPTFAGSAVAGDVGYVWMRTFSAEHLQEGEEALLAHLDTQLDRVSRTRALVLDLQYNTGGSSAVLVRVLERLLRERVVALRGKLLTFGPFRFEGDIEVEPRPPSYAGDIVVLVNAETASAAEWLAWILRRERGAAVVGERTAGAEAALDTVNGPDGTTLEYGRWIITDRDGHGFQDVGIEPDVSVPLTIESVEQLGYVRAQQLVREERLRQALERLHAEDRFEALRAEAEKGSDAEWENGRGSGTP
jgi:carboxyl-terminal processing protease